MNKTERKPSWLKVKLAQGKNYSKVKKVVELYIQQSTSKRYKCCT